MIKRSLAHGATALLAVSGMLVGTRVSAHIVGLRRVLPVEERERTPLMLAAESGKMRAVNALLAGGADVNALDREGWTALMYAANNGREAITQRLLRASANPDMADHIPLVGDETALSLAASRGHVAVVKLLVRGGVDLQSAGSGRALEAAASIGNSAELRLLLPEIAARFPPTRFQVALAMAVRAKHRPAARLLLQAGADPDIGFGDGTSPLILAASNDDREMVRLLLRSGADPNRRGDRGVTALIEAGQDGCAAVIPALLEAGADPDLTDSAGFTAREWAQKMGQERAAKLLSVRRAY